MFLCTPISGWHPRWRQTSHQRCRLLLHRRWWRPLQGHVAIQAVLLRGLQARHRAGSRFLPIKAICRKNRIGRIVSERRSWLGKFYDYFFGINRDHFVYAPSQWETTLHCNVVSHWLGAFTKWTLIKPFSEPMLTYCQLDIWEQISINFQTK